MKKLLKAGLVTTGLLMLGALSACGPVDDTYASCFDTADCNDLGDRCWDVDIPAAGTGGGFCSHECSGDFDCESNFGYAGVCYSLDSSAALCYQQCDFDSDCWSGNLCIEVALGGGVVDFICVPNN